MGIVAKETLEEDLQLESSAPLSCLFYGALDGSLSLEEDVPYQPIVNASLDSDVGLEGDIDSLYGAAAFCEDYVQATPELDYSRPLYHLITEGLDLEISLILPKGLFTLDLGDGIDFDAQGEQSEAEAVEGDVWECWVLNTQDALPSVYSGFNFNSYAQFQGVTYAASKQGVYKITDEHDEDFHSGVLFPETSFGMINHKRFRTGYLGFSGGKPAVKVKSDNGKERVLQVVRNEFKVSRDQAGRKWQFAVQDFGTLDFVEIQPILLSKGRRNG